MKRLIYILLLFPIVGFSQQSGKFRKVQVTEKITVPTGTTATDAVNVQQLSDSIRPYKVYTALLTQTDTLAPVATILELSMDTIVWTRTARGDYTGTLSGAFPSNKTFISSLYFIGEDDGNYIELIGITTNAILYQTSEDGATLYDQHGKVYIDIRVYY